MYYHSRFLRLWTGKDTEKIIDDDAIIIVDEQLKVFEQFSCSRIDVLKFLNDVEATQILKHFEAIQANCSDRGVYKDEHIYSRSLINDLVSKSFGDFYKRQLSEDVLDKTCEWSAFWNDSAERYVILSDDLQTATWIKSNILCPLPNKIIMLDGSAIYSNVKWDGFNIYTLQKNNLPTYENLTINALLKNPTQATLAKVFDDLAKSYETWAKKHKKARTWIASNKDAITCVKEWKKKHKDILEGFHGSIIGSNLYKDCDSAIMATSLFTSVEDYALRAAVANKEDINTNRIWKQSGKKLVPHMKLGGFVDNKINLEFKRYYSDIMYQYIMRGNIRIDSNADHSVFCCVGGFENVLELSRLLPGAKIIPIDDNSKILGLVEAYEKIKAIHDLKSISINELLKALGMTKNANRYDFAQELRELELKRREYLQKMGRNFNHQIL